MNVEPLEEKYRGFGWDVSSKIDGHDMEQVVDALEQSKIPSGKPLVILARHSQGQGRQLHGEHRRMARKDSQRGRTEERTRRVGGRRSSPGTKLLEEPGNTRCEVDGRLDAKMPRVQPQLLVECALRT